jgi:hypothetical protein
MVFLDGTALKRRIGGRPMELETLLMRLVAVES